MSCSVREVQPIRRSETASMRFKPLKNTQLKKVSFKTSSQPLTRDDVSEEVLWKGQCASGGKRRPVQGIVRSTAAGRCVLTHVFPTD